MIYTKMERTFEQDLQSLKDNVLMMASLVENNLKRALKLLVDRDDSLFDIIQAEEKQIDLLEMQLNNQVVLYIARQAPVASDLRFVLTVVKISSDLERCGDQAVNVAKKARTLNNEHPLKPLIDIPRMATISLEMLMASMDAFVNRKPGLVVEISERDKEVNEINRQLYRELTSFMVEDPSTISRCLLLMAISRHWERVADHGKNISKKVYYLYEGKDISHPDALS